MRLTTETAVYIHTFPHNYVYILQRCLRLLETAVLHTNLRGDQESGTVRRQATAQREDRAVAGV
ncbi:MAG: hypothetical protein GY805_03795 [Chloroflexi bacterium]|nr:hypothetical protein [Chloroflexota bacterium]